MQDPIKRAMEKKQGALAALMDVSPQAAAAHLKMGPLKQAYEQYKKDWRDTELACALARKRNFDNRKVSSTGNKLEGISKDGTWAESMSIPKILYIDLESRYPDHQWMTDKKLYKKELWDKYPQFRKVSRFQ